MKPVTSWASCRTPNAAWKRSSEVRMGIGCSQIWPEHGTARLLPYIGNAMDLFEKQAQLQSLLQASPVDAAYAQGTVTGRRIAGTYQDLDIALLLLQRVNASEFFDYQVYFVSELSKTLEIEGLDVVILNQASLLQRAQIIRSWSLLYQRDQKS